MTGYLRYLLGAACLAAACLYPFAFGPSPTAASFLFALCALAAAAGLFGVGVLSPWTSSFGSIAFLLILIRCGPYPEAWAAAGALVLLALAGFQTGAKLRHSEMACEFLLWAVTIAALVNSLEGVLQYLGLAGGLWPWVPESLVRGVALGSFKQPNLLASFVCCGIACLAWLLQKRRISQSLAWIFLVLMELGIAASASRIGLVGVLLLATASYVWRRDQADATTRLLLGQLGVYVASAAFMPWLATIHGFEPRSVSARVLASGGDSRWTLWRNAIDMIEARPWAGWGWGEFGYAHYVTLHGDRFGPGQVVDNAHNLPIHLAVELGTPIALLVSGMMIFACVRGRPWLAAKHGQQFAWALLLIIGAHSLLEFPLWYPPFIFIAAFAAGHLANDSRSCGRRWNAIPVTSTALLVAGSVGWMQYQTVSVIQNVPAQQGQAKARAVEAASGAWMFAGHVDFARLSLMSNSGADAASVRALAERLLHFSAEPAVIEPLLLALWQLDDRTAFHFHAKRYCQAFPRSYAHWLSASWVGIEIAGQHDTIPLCS
jgi:O-antigen ligase